MRVVRTLFLHQSSFRPGARHPSDRALSQVMRGIDLALISTSVSSSVPSVHADMGFNRCGYIRPGYNSFREPPHTVTLAPTKLDSARPTEAKVSSYCPLCRGSSRALGKREGHKSWHCPDTRPLPVLYSPGPHCMHGSLETDFPRA